jgi:hypothetical protein
VPGEVSAVVGGAVSVVVGVLGELTGGVGDADGGGLVGSVVGVVVGSVVGVVVGAITPGAEVAGAGELCVTTGVGVGPTTGTTATATGGAGLLIGKATVGSPVLCTGQGSEYEPSQHGPAVVWTGADLGEV